MSLSADQILDRIKLKKKLTSWRLVAIIAFVFLLLSVFSTDSAKPSKVSVIESNYIARIELTGMILNDRDRLEILNDIYENDAIKAVIVHISSGGGTPVGGENLLHAFRKISKKKPIVTVIDDMAASGAYMAAMGTDYIIARETSIAGSIGVISMSFEVTELAEKIGVKFNTIRTSPFKGGPIPTDKMSPEMRYELEHISSDVYATFVDMLKDRRKIKPEFFAEVTAGRVFTGRQSVVNGLIDALGDEETAINWLSEQKKVPADLKVKDIPLYLPDSRFNFFWDNIHDTMAIIKHFTSFNTVTLF
ncbi:MAG: signal peptide peptidase SppA [Rickettsiales bacterium]